jgi:Galactosyltransferase
MGSLVSWQNHNWPEAPTLLDPGSELRRLVEDTHHNNHHINHNNNNNNVVVAVRPDQVMSTTISGASHSKEPAAAVAQEKTKSISRGPPEHSRRLRVLFGILTADFKNDYSYRKRHRELFKLWNDPRVCSLPDYKVMPVDQQYVCEIVYTFVIGASPEAAPELVDDSRPSEATRPITGVCPDLNEPDMTLLNIKENMNEGKSQTWMKYGSEIATRYDLDYVVKCDADSILHLHEFFQFAYTHLPPAPYNKNIYVGALRDKAYWPRHKTENERIRFESYFGNNFEGVHLYVAGQIYMMSTDLARFIGKEAYTNKCSYCEGHEDHDISAMAFHSPDPIKLVVVGRNQRFWEHPVKGEPRWKRIWARETARMEGIPFEGKMFSKNSTFDEVYQME